MQKVRVSPEQLETIKSIAFEWDSNARWLPKLDNYLWEQDIRINEYTSPLEPSSYRFLAGGVDHIDETPDTITIYDRCCNEVDGTTCFIAS